MLRGDSRRFISVPGRFIKESTESVSDQSNCSILADHCLNTIEPHRTPE